MESPTIYNLINLIKELRESSRGCAWTREQTFASLAPQTIEESYELLDAIQSGNIDDIKNELGDLLYHIVFYSEIASEQGWFNFDDISKVMIDKHHERMPENREALTAEAINAHWQQLKTKRTTKNLLAKVPNHLPPLQRAYQVQVAASKVGFDWRDPQEILDKIAEECQELLAELAQQSDHIPDELGDLIFSCINLIRHLHHHPDAVLTLANHKFIRRFNYIEAQLQANKIDWSQASLDDMEALWQEAKKKET